MVLGACGDAIGHKNRSWEFNKSGASIHKEVAQITDGKGVGSLCVNAKNFPLSDDSMLNAATARALLDHLRDTKTQTPSADTVLAARIGKEYIHTFDSDPR